jgi:hypothetical protein
MTKMAIIFTQVADASYNTWNPSELTIPLRYQYKPALPKNCLYPEFSASINESINGVVATKPVAVLASNFENVYVPLLDRTSFLGTRNITLSVTGQSEIVGTSPEMFFNLLFPPGPCESATFLSK